MKLLIKVLDESNLYAALTLEGMCGRPYAFPWNKALDCYAYEPKNQEEITDIFATQGVICPWRFSPVIVEGDGQKGGALTIPPFIARHLYESNTDAELLALAADVGLKIEGPSTHDNIIRQLDAYMVGRAWGAKHPAEISSQPAPAPVPSIEGAAQDLGQKLKDSHIEQERLRKEVEAHAGLAGKVAELEKKLAATEQKLAASKKHNGTLKHQLAQALISKVRPGGSGRKAAQPAPTPETAPAPDAAADSEPVEEANV